MVPVSQWDSGFALKGTSPKPFLYCTLFFQSCHVCLLGWRLACFWYSFQGDRMDVLFYIKCTPEPHWRTLQPLACHPGLVASICQLAGEIRAWQALRRSTVQGPSLVDGCALPHFIADLAVSFFQRGPFHQHGAFFAAGLAQHGLGFGRVGVFHQELR